MRILYVINGFNSGGAEHGLLTLIENEAFKEHSLRVLALSKGHGQVGEMILSKLDPGSVVFVTEDNALSLRACVLAVPRIIFEMRKFRPDRLILSLKQANVVGRLAATLQPQVICVSFEHTSEYRSRKFQFLYGPILRVLSFRVDEIWADCAETLRATRRYFVSRSRKERVIPLFIANDQSPRKQDYSIGTPLKIAAAGRLLSGKRMTHLIEAIVELRRNGVLVDLDIYGEGPERAVLEAQIRDSGLSACVVLHGYKKDWLSFATASDVFVNLSDMEGFCIVVAEAMLAGLPVVATDVGGIRDYGRHEGNMLKLDPNFGIEQLYEAILYLATNQAKRCDLGHQARIDMLSNYGKSSFIRNIETAFV